MSLTESIVRWQTPRNRGVSLSWRLPILAMALLVCLPLSVIVFSWGDAQVDVWQHLIATQLGGLLSNTFWLLIEVAIFVTVVGVSLAWLTSVCDFPGRRWLDWALMLPLAIPTYVLAFVFLGVLDYSGPVQTQWRLWFGADAWFPDIYSGSSVALVMGCVLYPYVYMLARGAFMAQGRELMDAACLLGQGPWRGFFKVALPMALSLIHI